MKVLVNNVGFKYETYKVWGPYFLFKINFTSLDICEFGNDVTFMKTFKFIWRIT